MEIYFNFEARKTVLRAEDMEKGGFISASDLPKVELEKVCHTITSRRNLNSEIYAHHKLTVG